MSRQLQFKVTADRRKLDKLRDEITQVRHELDELRDSLNVRFITRADGSQHFAVFAGHDQLNGWMPVPE